MQITYFRFHLPYLCFVLLGWVADAYVRREIFLVLNIKRDEERKLIMSCGDKFVRVLSGKGACVNEQMMICPSQRMLHRKRGSVFDWTLSRYVSQ